MPFNTLRWRRIGYTVWSLAYDFVAKPLEAPRRRSIALLAPVSDERVLLVGAGTGLDLEVMPVGLRVTAIDVTPAMLARLRRRAARLGIAVDARVMDAQAMTFADSTFDAAGSSVPPRRPILLTAGAAMLSASRSSLTRSSRDWRGR